MQTIGDLTLIKFLGKGSFGEVYLSQKKGRKEYFATKKIARSVADSPNFKKYFDNELYILKTLNHPNIVKLEGKLATEKHYYIIMEYINGGGLSDCLKKYKEKYNQAFPEEIVQYLMRQIIDGLCYIHKQKIIHRDLKLDNIMVNFDNIADKESLNMMKATIKLIDFGFATKLSADNNNLTFSAVGSPLNMSPTILKKFSKNKDDNIGYDDKADIWSIGTVCYELLIGKAVFNAQSLGDLLEKIENGQYYLPKTVSKEVVSFLNGMLQYDSNLRLSSEELSKHPFLTKNVKYFEKMNTSRAKKKPNQGIKKSIWAIFDDEEKYINIQGGKNLPMAPIPEERVEKSKENFISRYNSEPYINNNNSNNYQRNNTNKNYNRANSGKYNNNTKLTSFYGQSMLPDGPAPNPNAMPKMGGGTGMNIPSMGIPQKPPQQMMYPSFGVGMPFSNINYNTNYTPQNNMNMMPNTGQNFQFNKANDNYIGEGGKDNTNCCII